MLRVTYFVTPVSAMRLAVSPRAAPPTPSATMASEARRSLSLRRPSASGTLEPRTTSCRRSEQRRKWSWFSRRTFPGWVTPWASISSSRGLRAAAGWAVLASVVGISDSWRAWGDMRNLERARRPRHGADQYPGNMAAETRVPDVEGTSELEDGGPPA